MGAGKGKTAGVVVRANKPTLKTATKKPSAKKAAAAKKPAKKAVASAIKKRR